MFPPSSSYSSLPSVVSLAGFPRDRSLNPGITYENQCRVRDVGPGLLIGIDCSVVAGTSGGPVLQETDGLFYGIAIAIFEEGSSKHVPAYTRQTRNIAVLSETFLATLAKILTVQPANR